MGHWILVVDDEPLSLTNAKTILRAKNMRVSCIRSGMEMLEFVEKHTPDLILLDILMPEMDGFEAYRALRRYENRTGKPEIPVIFITGEDNSEAERRGLKAGASDFIHKPIDEDVLVNRINKTIENRKTIESLTEEASLDKLTGFYNKASGTEKISAFCRNTAGMLLIFDLDNFKLVNDIFGHDMGDRVLMAFASIVRRNVRQDDILCRIGGDEFMTFFQGFKVETLSSMSKLLNKELSEEADRLMGYDHGIPLGISIGAAISKEDANDFQILFQYADNALYEVKRNGKHGYQIYNPDAFRNDGERDLNIELSRIEQIMKERGDTTGALLLGHEAFSWNYRFIERFHMRYGGTATRILFSLSSEEKGVVFSEMVAEFGRVLRKTLRKTDIIYQWQHNCYFAVLPMLDEKNITNVTDRIMSLWKETGYNDRLKVEFASSQIRKEEYERK